MVKEIGRFPGWNWMGETQGLRVPFTAEKDTLGATFVTILTFGRLQNDQEHLWMKMDLSEIDMCFIDEAQQQRPDALLVQACMPPFTVVARIGDTEQSAGGMGNRAQRDNHQYYKKRQGGVPLIGVHHFARIHNS